MTYGALGRKGLQWPVDADGIDAPTLYEESSSSPAASAQFAALPYKVPGDRSIRSSR